MLVQFSIRNYKLFREKATLSWVASNYDRDTREEENVYFDEGKQLRLLKSSVIYGANASGKTRLLEAIGVFRQMVLESSRMSQKGEALGVDPFRLNIETENEPTEFEIIFLYENILYRYGFEATPLEIVSEWLYYKPKTKEVELFYRDGNNFEVHSRKFSKGDKIAKAGMVRNNALFLSVAAQFNEELAIRLIDAFLKVKLLSGIFDQDYQAYTLSQMSNLEKKANILKLLKSADFGIQDVMVEQFTPNNLPANLSSAARERLLKEFNEQKALFFSEVETAHQKFDKLKNRIGIERFLMEEDESAGTQKYFAMSGPILDVLETGSILIVDELDARLHPNLVEKIVLLFNSKDTNPNNAQLIFNTHNTNLLNSKLFRRDQIWFTTKNEYGEAQLYSLADFKSNEVNKNENFEENYIRGKYGAVPILNRFNWRFEKVFDNENEKQKGKPESRPSKTQG